MSECHIVGNLKPRPKLYFSGKTVLRVFKKPSMETVLRALKIIRFHNVLWVLKIPTQSNCVVDSLKKHQSKS